MKTYLIAALLFLATSVPGQESRRVQHTINESWVFFKDAAEAPVALSEIEAEEVEIVDLPHTWNAQDVVDEAPGYYRGPAWYIRKVRVPAHYQSKSLFIYFEGVNQETDVFVNGKRAGRHIGGYTRFVVPVSDFIAAETTEFELAVRVDNAFNEDIPTLTADFTFYGGIYRDVSLIVTEQVHFNLEDHASNGVYIRTPAVSATEAEVEVEIQLKNDDDAARRVKLETEVFGPNAELVQSGEAIHALSAGQVLAAKPAIAPIENPRLWSPDTPNLYRMVCRLYDAETDRLLDEVVNSFGLRWFSFDADKGFFLNGEHLKLIGTNRHQDYAGLGNALPDYIHREDIKKMKEMGSNFLRIAHYPQDPAVLELCDRLGILTAIEVPIVNTITESEAFKQNCLNMHLEMMRQNYNHPSLIIWAYMNEVLLRPKYRDEPEKRKAYLEKVYEVASAVEDLTRKEDPYRYTMLVNHGSLGINQESGVTELPMILGWNVYNGWYKGDVTDFAQKMIDFHEAVPDKPIIVAEYGAGADPRLHSLNPERFDFTVEYATRFHEHYLSVVRELPFIAGATVWNFADFTSEGRVDTVPNVNNKGLIGLDRVPKDAYFFYQAALLSEPFIGIAAKTWIRRACVEDEAGEGVCSMPVEVFSNQSEVELFHNGISLGMMAVSDNKATFEVPFTDGINRLRAVSTANRQTEDLATVRMDVLPIRLDEFPAGGLAINCGDPRFFHDDVIDQAWLPEKAYVDGSWGYVGGEVFSMEKTPRQSFGTSQPINGTNCDPLYQTQRIGIEQYRFDVPAGMYEVTFHLAELTGQMSESLPYNLDGTDDKPSRARNRSFGINVNGSPVIEQLHLARDYGSFRAVNIKAMITVNEEETLVIDFVPGREQAVINGIELNRKL